MRSFKRYPSRICNRREGKSTRHAPLEIQLKGMGEINSRSLCTCGCTREGFSQNLLSRLGSSIRDQTAAVSLFVYSNSSTVKLGKNTRLFHSTVCLKVFDPNLLEVEGLGAYSRMDWLSFEASRVRLGQRVVSCDSSLIGQDRLRTSRRPPFELLQGQFSG